LKEVCVAVRQQDFITTPFGKTISDTLQKTKAMTAHKTRIRHLSKKCKQLVYVERARIELCAIRLKN